MVMPFNSSLYFHHLPLPRNLANGPRSIKAWRDLLYIFLPGFPAFPCLAPYLTSFPTTPHYTPFTVVKPVSPRHLTHFLGLSSCWNALLPLPHLFNPPNISPLLLRSFPLLFPECPLCIRHYAKCQTTTENRTHRLAVTMVLLVLWTLSLKPSPTHLLLLLPLVRLILSTSHYCQFSCLEFALPTMPPPANWIFCALRAGSSILYFFYLYLCGSALGTPWAPQK